MSKSWKTLIAGVVLAGGVSSGAIADGYEPVGKGFAPPPVYSWSGVYVGVHAGYGWGDTEATDRLGSNGKPWNELGDRFSADTDGAVVGGHLGYNWQSGNLVWGVEGDVGWLGGSGTGTSSESSDTHVKSDGGLFVTARGRLGVAFERSLVYVTGGYMGADLNSNVFDNIGTALTTSDAGFQSGWTVGGGLEHALHDGWSLKGEYLYYDLGEERVSGVCDGCAGTVVQPFNIENTGNIVRLGLNKRW